MSKKHELEILNIIRSNQSNEEIKERLFDYHESDIAEVFPALSLEEREKIYNILPPEVISDIFSFLDDVDEYIEEMENIKAAKIIGIMDVDDAVDVLDELDEDDRREILDLIDEDSAEEIKKISAYDEDLIGSMMTTNYIAMSKDLTIKQAMKTLVTEAAENDNVSMIYFYNNDQFYGALELGKLIVARENDDLTELIKTSYPYLYDTEEISEALPKIKKYDLESIPVVNEQHQLIGVITSGDIIEAVEDEKNEDYAMLAGLASEEDLEESIFSSVKKRLPWLMILLVLGLIVSLLISGFESVVISLPIIVFFQSLVLDVAGNSGTQSLAVTLGTISSDDLDSKKILKVTFKELRIGIMDGALIGIISFIMVTCFLGIKEGNLDSQTWKTSSTIAISVFTAMTVSTLVGTIIPIFFKKIHIDPAVASGPLITTLNDIVGIVVYYGLAYFLLL